jgi:hypothetical protein
MWPAPPSQPSAPALSQTARVFAALGDVTRLGLVTKHLHVLASAELAHSARAGREIIWQLDPARLADARAQIDQISAQWDQALGRLKAMVESGED